MHKALDLFIFDGCLFYKTFLYKENAEYVRKVLETFQFGETSGWNIHALTRVTANLKLSSYIKSKATFVQNMEKDYNCLNVKKKSK